jgi:hypothetical protein
MGFSLRYRERLEEGTADELDKLIKFLKQFLLTEHNEDGTHIVSDPTTNVAAADVAYVTVGNTSSLSAERALTGTANQITITDNGANSTVQIGTVQSIGTSSSPTFAGLTVSALTAGRVPVAGTAGLLGDDADLTFSGDTLTATKVATTSLQSSGDVRVGGAAGAATTYRAITKKVTGIADNSATDVLTVTVPNGNHAAALRLLLLSSNGSTDAFESSRTAIGNIVIARTAGLNAVAAAATLTGDQIATVSGGATHLLSYGVSSISGAVGATNTFTVTVTINDSGDVGSNQVVVFAELLNAESTGITLS